MKLSTTLVLGVSLLAAAVASADCTADLAAIEELFYSLEPARQAFARS